MLNRRAGVVGSPIEHSLSPALHRTAYAELGLTGWTYDRTEVVGGELARHVAGLGPEWVGLSVTMPGKEEALALAEHASEEAVLAQSANTLLAREHGWYADNTDVYGLATALREAGAGSPAQAVVIGGGATARSAVLALRSLGVSRVEFYVRDRLRPQTEELLERLDLERVVRPLSEPIPVGGDDQVVVGTLPGSAPPPRVRDLGNGDPLVLDVSYAPWPSRLAQAVATASGGRVCVVRGTGMLLHQAVRQVELMTGRAAPVAAMAAVLRERTGEEGSG